MIEDYHPLDNTSPQQRVKFLRIFAECKILHEIVRSTSPSSLAGFFNGLRVREEAITNKNATLHVLAEQVFPPEFVDE